jgi:hypothetical protein
MANWEHTRKTINKEDRNFQYIAISKWLVVFIPDLGLTPTAFKVDTQRQEATPRF